MGVLLPVLLVGDLFYCIRDVCVIALCFSVVLQGEVYFFSLTYTHAKTRIYLLIT